MVNDLRPQIGRHMISHIHVGCASFNRASTFNTALLQQPELRRRKIVADEGPASVCWIQPKHVIPSFHVVPRNAPVNGLMLAFNAKTPDTIASDQSWIIDLNDALVEGNPRQSSTRVCPVRRNP